MKKLISYAALAVMALSVFTGCASSSKTEINVGVIKGPTGIGTVELMEKSESGETEGLYNISVAASPDEVNGKIAKGELDIAAVPTNVAPLLYNKDNGAYSVLAVNTLGVLYVLENGNTVNSVQDLSGKTIYMAGQGAVPEYVINYILEKNGIDDTEIVFMTEHTEAAAALADGRADIVILPEPNVTAAMMQNEKIRIALDLTEEWKNVSGNDMAMGCIIVRNDFLKDNKEAVDTFLDEYEDSIEYVNENTAEAAQLVEKYGIMASAKAAEKAIPNCNIVYIDGDEMENILSDFYGVLYEANPKSIGGNLPGADFYYEEN
ncbi:MAG: ABC transporter substrate-binding protein [Eubacteriales bacterium]|nr:ABC transporter substrate-binding protein [Eubacteriales bacterium]